MAKLRRYQRPVRHRRWRAFSRGARVMLVGAGISLVLMACAIDFGHRAGARRLQVDHSVTQFAFASGRRRRAGGKLRPGSRKRRC